MKYEWRKQDKEIYLPKAKPQILDVAKHQFFTISGKGNPNDEIFSEAIGVLYKLSYAVKMLPKKGIIPDGYFDYTVFPLEGIWEKEDESEPLNKDKLIYTIMIRQPDFVTNEIAETVIESVKNKNPHALLDKVKFEKISDGMCVQMLHIGSYDDEQISFEQMDIFCNENSLKRVSNKHREIYISDAKKVEKSKLKTVLRYSVVASPLSS